MIPRHLSRHLVRTVTGPMWHGPSLAEALKGVTSEQAAAHPIPGAHSIWEVVLHVTAWAEIAHARLHGRRIADPPPEEDWPAVGDTTPERWTAATAKLEESYRALAADVNALEESALQRTPEGLTYPIAILLHGVVEHGTYHGGQIALLKRARG